MSGPSIASLQSRKTLLEVDRMRRAGVSKRAISQSLGLSIWTVNALLKRIGVERGEVQAPQGLPSRRFLGRCGKSFRPPHKGRFMCDTCVRSASGAVYGW